MRSLLLLAVVCTLYSQGLCLFHSNSDFDETKFNFEADLEPWSSQRARDDELEFYDCIQDNGQFCLVWTANERSTAESEYGSCECNEETAHYCASWFCVQTEINYSGYEAQAERTTCLCNVASNGDNYCEQWTCTEIGSDGAVENEIYSCLKTHKSGRYCERWTGDIFSDKEIESSVCQCDQKGKNFCKHWTCKERGLKMCEKGGRGWCNFPLAVGLAGGVGVVATLGALVYSILKKQRPFSRFVLFVPLAAILCLPWTAAVVIWGGVKALTWVAIMWGITFLISVASLSLIRSGPTVA